jgi:ribonucleoside-triphosphate reductase
MEEKIKVKCEIYSRVVGYMRPVSQWNSGKAAEFRNRKLLQIPDVELLTVSTPGECRPCGE